MVCRNEIEKTKAKVCQKLERYRTEYVGMLYNDMLLRLGSAMDECIDAYDIGKIIQEYEDKRNTYETILEMVEKSIRRWYEYYKSSFGNNVEIIRKKTKEE